jgi:SulP family sulfate permease
MLPNLCIIKINMRLFNEINFNNLRGDLFGGVTAAIIALPMALAFGVASGAGPEAGLYGAVLIGLFAALFGATPTLISEPTGPMTVVMTAVVASLIAGNPEQGLAMAFTVVMLAGILQIVFGFLKLGDYVTMMPYTVISGFMSGIGIILIILQFAPFLGHAAPGGGVIGTIESLPSLIADIQMHEVFLAVMTLALIAFFPKKLSRYMPPQLLALIVGTIVAMFAFSEYGVRIIGEIPTELPDFQMPVFSGEQWTMMLINAIVLAVLGSIDALLTSVIAENMTRKESDSNKELFGQGLGNLASGMFGGLPGAGATMGTVLNIKAGGQTALSGLIRAFILLIVILWAADLTAQIPLAVLAGIAFKVGFDIIDWGFLKRAHIISKKTAFIMYGVIVLTVFVDLITAVAIGIFVANFLTIQRITNIQNDSLKAIDGTSSKCKKYLNLDEFEILEQAKGKVLVFTLQGALVFGMAKVISRRHSVLDDHQVLLVDFTEVPALGVSASLALEDMILGDIKAGRLVYIAGASQQVKTRLTSLGILNKITDDCIFETREEALRSANEDLDNKQF